MSERRPSVQTEGRFPLERAAPRGICCDDHRLRSFVSSLASGGSRGGHPLRRHGQSPRLADDPPLDAWRVLGGALGARRVADAETEAAKSGTCKQVHRVREMCKGTCRKKHGKKRCHKGKCKSTCGRTQVCQTGSCFPRSTCRRPRQRSVRSGPGPRVAVQRAAVTKAPRAMSSVSPSRGPFVHHRFRPGPPPPAPPVRPARRDRPASTPVAVAEQRQHLRAQRPAPAA